MLGHADQDVGGILDEGVGLHRDFAVERVGRASKSLLGAPPPLALDFVELLAALLGRARLGLAVDGGPGLDCREDAQRGTRALR